MVYLRKKHSNMQNIVIINGHPNPNSLCQALADAYLEGALQTGSNAELVNLHQLKFEPNLKYGYQKRTDLEPDLTQTWEKIKKADHLVWVYPNWWGTYPALLKAFIDRLFLPGMAFTSEPNSLKYQKLLKGKTAHIIYTMDSPWVYFDVYLKAPGINALKKSVLSFCGVRTKKITKFRIVKNANQQTRERWIEKTKLLGKKLK
jgi:NAD(P)H dehydrogenase (quinone)